MYHVREPQWWREKGKSQNNFDILVFPDKDIIFEKDYIKQYETLIRCPSETI